MKTDLRPVSEQTKDAVDRAISRILLFSETARKNGLLALIPLLDKEAFEDRNNLFEYGIAMVCNGYDTIEIKDILQNIQSLKDQAFTQKIVDTLYIIGVLGIQAGDNPQMLIQRLDSRVPEQCRSDWLCKRVTKINLELVNEDEFPRAYLRPEEATTEFEKIATLTDEQIQKIIREVDTENLAWAVKNNEKMKGVFYHNISKQCAELGEAAVRETQETNIDESQKYIVAVAKKLKFI